jgi:hypothetical protein
MLVGEKVGMDATGRRAAAQGGGRNFFFRVVLRSGEGRVTLGVSQRTVSACKWTDTSSSFGGRARCASRTLHFRAALAPRVSQAMIFFRTPDCFSRPSTDGRSFAPYPL